LAVLFVLGWFSISIFFGTNSSRFIGVTPTPTATVSFQFSISELIEYLNASDAKTRVWAAQSLAERGAEAKPAIPGLRSELKDKDREVRAAAKAALAKISLSSGTDENSQQPAAGNDAGQPASSSFQFTTPSDGQVLANQSSYETEQLRNEIESAKDQLRQLEAEMDPIEDQLDSLKAQIDSYAATIRGYESSIALGVEVDRVGYKNTLSRHNSLVEEHNQLLAEYRSMAAKHKALVRETNEKVNRYNNLIRGQR
jgi:archaellum component FlaC